MTYIRRSLERKFLKMSSAFKAVMVTGARQVGKSTMLKHLARNSGRTYVSMDDSGIRDLAQRDPKLLFQMYKPPVMIDEAQNAPPGFSNEIKRLIKTPKLYFCDSGLCAFLSSWTSRDVLMNGAASGSFFKNHAVIEMVRNASYGEKEINLNFYHDTNQKEIDIIAETEGILHPLEVKRSALPDLKAVRTFSLLEKTERSIGTGGIICMAEKPFPVDTRNSLIPVNLL